MAVESRPVATECSTEAKIIKDVLAAAITVQPADDSFQKVLNDFELWKALRIGAWVQRFISNCEATVANIEMGPLTTREIETESLVG